MEDKEIFVFSSNGRLSVNKYSGIVNWNESFVSKNADDHFKSIEKVDLQEWSNYHDDILLEDYAVIDILDLGYWYRIDDVLKYESPCDDFRNEIKTNSDTHVIFLTK